MSLSDLKTLLARRFVHTTKPRLQVLITSFGYKHGLPLDSDLVLDTRFLPNPFYMDRLKNLTGSSRPVRDFVLRSDVTERFLAELFRFLDFLMPLRRGGQGQRPDRRRLHRWPPSLGGRRRRPGSLPPQAEI